MKNMNRIFLLAATSIGLTLTFPALAGGQQIAASPKLRQMLDERAAVVSNTTAPTVSVKDCCADQNLAASPKVQQIVSSRPKCCAASGVEISTVSRPEDGIAASPKVRTQLNERSTQFQIAPLK
jgi:hypothetical protein